MTPPLSKLILDDNNKLLLLLLFFSRLQFFSFVLMILCLVARKEKMEVVEVELPWMNSKLKSVQE